MGVLFFFLPILLSMGVALQAVAVYLAALAPAVALLRGERDREVSFPFAVIGAAILVGFVAFPLSNGINFFVGPGATVADLAWPPPIEDGWRKMLESRFSSAFLISGVALLLWGWCSSRKVSARRLPRGIEILRWFLYGLAVATLLVTPYFLFQAVTGFDYRSPGHLLLPEHRMNNGLYRIFGFYGHPLSVAGVSLAWFSLAWSLFWLSWNEEPFALPLRNLLGEKLVGRLNLRLVLAVVGFLHLSFIALSGGRTALAVAGLVFAVVPFAVGVSRRVARWRNFAVAFGGIACVGLGLAAGYGGRLFEVVKALQSGETVDDRFSFWRVYGRIILDRPLLGQGHFWLENSTRKEYYLRMGYERLANEKNYNAHNLYLETLGDIGIIGAVVLVACAFVVARSLSSRGSSNPTARCLGLAVLTAFLANLLHGVTENTYFVSNIALPYLVFLWTLIWVIFTETATQNDPVPGAAALPAKDSA